jgi:hypothetical protein
VQIVHTLEISLEVMTKFWRASALKKEIELILEAD